MVGWCVWNQFTEAKQHGIFVRALRKEIEKRNMGGEMNGRNKRI